jgi:hypothetical protein
VFQNIYSFVVLARLLNLKRFRIEDRMYYQYITIPLLDLVPAHRLDH